MGCRTFAGVGSASLCIVLQMEQPAPRRSKVVSIRYAQSVWLRTRWSGVRVPPGAPIIKDLQRFDENCSPIDCSFSQWGWIRVSTRSTMIDWWLEADAYSRLALAAPFCVLALGAFAWILFKRTPGKPPLKEFVEWCRDETPVPDHVLDVETFDRQRTPPRGDWGDREEKQFFEEVNDRLRANQTFSVSINKALNAPEHTIVGTQSGYESYLTNLDIGYHVKGVFKIENVSIKRLTAHSKPTRMTIKNCDIAWLRVNRQTFSNLTIQDSNIGTLELDGGQCLAHYDMRSGSILNVECEPPGPGNPFTGPVSLRTVFLPRDSENYLLKGPQPYRNLRLHLLNLGNVPAASLVHAAELAVEREEEYTKTQKLMSILYQLFSDFGLSAFRPIGWLIALFLVSVILVWATDGATLLEGERYFGWRSILQWEDWLGSLWRALVMSAQPVANPIGIFRGGTLLVPEYTWLAIWLRMQTLFSIILVALFIFAVRRRFKMQ